MFKKWLQKWRQNPLDRLAQRTARRGGTKVLLGWNRGLGDLALGLYAIVKRLYIWIPHAEITFLTRENLREGFSLLNGVSCIVDPELKRGEKLKIYKRLEKLKIDPASFDLVIEAPSPTDWVSWQRGWITPRLKWRAEYEKRFPLPQGFHYIGVQVAAETAYGLWRNWPEKKWQELFDQLARWPKVKVLLFGFGNTPLFPQPHVIDLRGKTSLYEALSIMKRFCKQVVFPDSGLLSMLYYLDEDFPIEVISLWADPRHGILKQKVASPNGQLVHTPLFGSLRDLNSLSVDTVLKALFPLKPLTMCPSFREVLPARVEGVGAIILAGGQGSRFGSEKPKGLFPIHGKSLFEWIVKKLPPQGFPLAVLTSPLNHEETVSFFRAHQNFGREIFFFSQGMAHFLDDEKKELPFLAPCGNGQVYQAFAESGLLKLFRGRGVDTMVVCQVDNPLADPADPFLISHHRQTGADATVKCIPYAGGSMGALVERGGKIEVLEYLELEEGVSYPYRYMGMMAFSLSFMEKAASFKLPIHLVKKKIPLTGGLFGWKPETFIFDALPKAARVSALCFDRQMCYAPLKTAEGLRELEQLLKQEK